MKWWQVEYMEYTVVFCCSDRRETRTQIQKNIKNHISYQIQKPISVFYEYQKPTALKQKIAMSTKTKKVI